MGVYEGVGLVPVSAAEGDVRGAAAGEGVVVYERGGGIHFDDGDELADGDECGAVDGGWVGGRRAVGGGEE